MSCFNKEVKIPAPLRGEYVITVKEHCDKSDEKGDRYLIKFNIKDRTLDYYIFPNPDKDYKLDSNGNLEKSQINYLLMVFSNILNIDLDNTKVNLVDLIETLRKENIEFLTNITYNTVYSRNNYAFYAKPEVEKAITEM